MTYTVDQLLIIILPAYVKYNRGKSWNIAPDRLHNTHPSSLAYTSLVVSMRREDGITEWSRAG